VNLGEASYLLDRRPKRNRSAGIATALRQLDRNEPCQLRLAIVLDHQVGDTPRGWIDHDVGELPKARVRAVDPVSELQLHLSLLPLLGESEASMLLLPTGCHERRGRCRAGAAAGSAAAAAQWQRRARPSPRAARHGSRKKATMSSVTEPTSAKATRREPILICYDDSPDAVRAIEADAALLGPRRAVADDVLPWMTPAESTASTSSLVPGNAFEELNSAEARRIAGRGAEIARSAGFEAEPRGELASATWERIVGLADELDAAVIVIGARGLTGMKKIFDASVSRQVAEHAGRPVLIVSPPR
jgi:nucleotide-binding universal stress UspA family protein